MDGGEGFQKANTHEQSVLKYSDKCERYEGGVQIGSKTANAILEWPLTAQKFCVCSNYLCAVRPHVKLVSNPVLSKALSNFWTIFLDHVAVI